MGLKVNTNVEALAVHNSLVGTNTKVADSLKKLSSGLRIVSARDDAAGYAVANSFKAKIASMRVASQNASEAQSMLQVADGAYSKIHDILVRMKSLATQAASDQSRDNLLTMHNEFVLMREEIDRIANSTKYGSTTLVDGSGTAISGITFQVGANATASDRISVKFNGATAACLALISTAISSASYARTAMDTIDTALTSMNSFMGEIGAYQNRLQYTIENLSISIENFTSSESTIRDVDMAEEMSSFTKSQILQQSGMSMLAQANSAPQQILTLLR